MSFKLKISPTFDQMAKLAKHNSAIRKLEDACDEAVLQFVNNPKPDRAKILDGHLAKAEEAIQFHIRALNKLESTDFDPVKESTSKIKKAKDKFGKFKIGGRRNISFFIVIVLLIWLAIGFYRVEPNEQGVELLFGKWNQTTTEPGLHYFFPTPIGKVMTPKVEAIRKINVGYRSASELGFSTGSGAERNILEESLMLTGDQNISDVHFTVLYKIKDAGKFLFKLRNPETTVKDMSESVMREVVGQRDLQFLLTGGRQEVEQVVRNNLQDILDEYESGILIQSIQLQSVNPPALVIDAFDEVQRAR